MSYSCVPNMHSIIRTHNKKLQNKPVTETPKSCNCRKKDDCPLTGKCQTASVIYNSEVAVENQTDSKLYIGLTEDAFKQRYNNHTQTFKHEKYEYSTELSKYIWSLKRNQQNFKIKWSIQCCSRAYLPQSKRCNLCLTEKLSILSVDNCRLLNKRSELISKCRHENKYYLSNI